MLWSDLVTQLGSFCQQEAPNTNPSFTTSLPTFSANAELRIYRDLDFLATRGQNHSLSFTIGSRTLSMAGMTGATVGGFPVQNAYPVVVQALAAIVPAPSSPSAGTRVRFLLTSVDFIDSVWPQESQTLAPAPGLAYYAMLDHQTAIVAPTPDKAYVAEVTGTWRPEPIGPTNVESWLGDNLPDLLFYAAMVEASGWMRDTGQTMAEVGGAVFWESRYKAALQNAMEEEQRRKGSDPGWQPFSPTPLAGTPRS